MIPSTRGKLTREVTDRFGKGLPADLAKRIRIMPSAFEAAKTLEDLRFSSGSRHEALTGNPPGQDSLRINDRRRTFFIWTDFGPEEVEIVDYHRKEITG